MVTTEVHTPTLVRTGAATTRANGFPFQLESPSFLVSFKIMIQFFQILRDVTVNLQRKAADVVQDGQGGCDNFEILQDEFSCRI